MHLHQDASCFDLLLSPVKCCQVLCHDTAGAAGRNPASSEHVIVPCLKMLLHTIGAAPSPAASGVGAPVRPQADATAQQRAQTSTANAQALQGDDGLPSAHVHIVYRFAELWLAFVLAFSLLSVCAVSECQGNWSWCFCLKPQADATAQQRVQADTVNSQTGEPQRPQLPLQRQSVYKIAVAAVCPFFGFLCCQRMTCLDLPSKDDGMNSKPCQDAQCFCSRQC